MRGAAIHERQPAPSTSRKIEDLLSDFYPSPASPHPVVVQQALFVARRLQQRATELQTPAERRQQAELDRMLQTPSDKSTLAQMIDQAFRARTPSRAVGHLVHILDVQGVPRFFSPLDRTLPRGFQSFGGYAPGVAFRSLPHRAIKPMGELLRIGPVLLSVRVRPQRREICPRDQISGTLDGVRELRRGDEAELGFTLRRDFAAQEGRFGTQFEDPVVGGPDLWRRLVAAGE